MYYIQETDKPSFLAKAFNIIKLEGDKIILPINEKAVESKKLKKLAKKTKKIFEKTKSKKIIISKKIQMQEEYVNWLYTYNLDIVEGKWLFEVLSTKILDYVLEKQGLKKEETKLSILINDLSENMLANLRNMAQEYKLVNIITNHREKFKKIEKQILEEDGIMITIGNNKKKGLAKAELVLNVDFPHELINSYQINENAIIINLKGNVKIEKKRFNGMVINDYEITVENEDDFDYDKKNKYKINQVYEAKINKKQPFEQIMKQIGKDKVRITQLIGGNNRI